MTPELKTACELVFQEHKTNGDPINWNKDTFRGQLSFGLSAMAKETLLERNIIYTPNPSKKALTVLNPLAVAATNFEEAVELIQTKTSVLTTAGVVKEPFYATHCSSNNSEYSNYVLLRATSKPATVIIKQKWHMKPWLYYSVWLAGAAIAGAFIAWLIGFLSTELLLK